MTLTRRLQFSGHLHGIARRSDGIQYQPRQLLEGDRAKKAPVVHARRAHRLPHVELRAAARRRSNRARSALGADAGRRRSEEHTSELQSLMRISYAVFCLKKKTNTKI